LLERTTRGSAPGTSCGLRTAGGEPD
jgi:hypothetical protein